MSPQIRTTPLRDLAVTYYETSSTPIRVKVLNPRLSFRNKHRLNFEVQDGSAIRKAVAWDDDAHRVHGQLEHNKTYIIKNYQVRKPDRKYNRDPIELIMTNSTSCELQDMNESTFDRPSRTIANALCLGKDELSTLRVRITKFGDIEDSPNQNYSLRAMYIVDQSAQESKILLFDDEAHSIINDFEIGDCVMVTNVRAQRGGYFISTPITWFDPIDERIDNYSYVR